MSDSYSLLCYTRVPTSREEANNEDIAFSMHLALRSHLDGSWTPLNENYGIFFAAGVPIAAATPESRRACTAAARFKTDPYTTVRAASDAVAHGAAMPGVDIELKSLKDPHLFRLASGRFAVAATRTARGGGADGIRTVGVPAGDQPRPDVVRSARTGAAWPHVRRTPSHGHIQRCRTSVRHPVA